jgi:hypothetical protein
MSVRFLKVKIKSLTAEARIIRVEEGRSRGDLRAALRAHRQWDVRREQRATQLAYGYLRGRARRQVEPSALSEPDWDRVTAMVKKYAGARMKPGDAVALDFEAWRTAA